MKKTLNHIIKAAVLLVLLAAALFGVSKLTQRKEGENKYAGFLESPEEYDVLFLGSSHVLDGILPLELWNDQGIASYNLGYHKFLPKTSYWILKNALLKMTPKLVVIDGFFLESNDESIPSEYIHKGFDAFPLTLEKVQGVSSLIPEDEGSGKDWKNLLPYLWDFPLYHERWNDLTSEDVVLNNNVEKGAERRIGVSAPNEQPEETWVNPNRTDDTVGAKYMKMIIDECQKRGIEVLLVYLPSVKEEATYFESQLIDRIANEKGVHCVNLFSADFMNSNTDYYDYWGHLNPAGAKKVTRYIGDYIVQNYDIPDHRGDEAYYDWYDDYDLYVSREARELKNVLTLSDYMMMLSAENYDVVIEISDLKMWDNELFKEQLKEMGVDVNSLTENTDLIVLSDGGWDATLCEYFNDQQQLGTDPYPTVLGDMQKEWTDDNQIVLKLNGSTLYSIQNYDKESACPVKIMVMDRTTKKLIDTAFFEVETEFDPYKLNTGKIYR